MAKRHENPPFWHDKPEEKSMTMNVNGQNVALHVGNVAIALFRMRPEMDYIAVATPGEDETDDHEWTFLFGYHDLCYWMGGLALHPDGQRSLHLSNRRHGSFYDNYGWAPDIVIETYPSQNEVDTYIDWQARGLEDPHGDLNNALKEDFDEGE